MARESGPQVPRSGLNGPPNAISCFPKLPVTLFQQPSDAMPQILLVEDNKHSYEMLTRRLKRRGYDMALAMDGEAAVEKAEAEQPDLILMDINLPKQDGWEATRQIRAFPGAGADVPIIALTARAGIQAEREKAQEVGCDDYHAKPVELVKLCDQIETLLAEAQAA